MLLPSVDFGGQGVSAAQCYTHYHKEDVAETGRGDQLNPNAFGMKSLSS